MPRNLYCNVLGNSPNVQNLVSKIFAKYCKRLVLKVSSLISVLERSSLGLVSIFFSKSRSRRGLATSMSRLGLEDFGRDSSSVNKGSDYSTAKFYLLFFLDSGLFFVQLKLLL